MTESDAAPTRPSAAPTWPTIGGGALPIRRILSVQPQRLGDVLCATPLVTALRRQFAQAHLTLLVRPGMDALLQGNPDVDDVLFYDRDATRYSPARLLQFIRMLRQG